MKKNSVSRKILRTIALGTWALVATLTATWQAKAQDAKGPYPAMAPLDQYLMERNAEIALARSAAPPSISQGAEIMVLGQHNYETAVQGKNGFVCLVWRSWSAGTDDPDFWNPRQRGPVCLNASAARFQVPITLKKTEVIFASRSKDQMAEAIKAAFDRKELSTPEPGAMCYMMSKQGYLNDRAGHWHPHLMFFLPLTDLAVWGAGPPDAPVLGDTDALDRFTLFLIPIGQWSDGSADGMNGH
jgi:hypothetical protein